MDGKHAGGMGDLGFRVGGIERDRAVVGLGDEGEGGGAGIEGAGGPTITRQVES
jgi:hypothetical protein